MAEQTGETTRRRRLGQSPWVVTHRRKVHLRTCASARRVAEPMSWLPMVQRPTDHACVTCLGGVLPDEVDEQYEALGAALSAALTSSTTPLFPPTQEPTS